MDFENLTSGKGLLNTLLGWAPWIAGALALFFGIMKFSTGKDMDAYSIIPKSWQENLGAAGRWIGDKMKAFGQWLAGLFGMNSAPSEPAADAKPPTAPKNEPEIVTPSVPSKSRLQGKDTSAPARH